MKWEPSEWKNITHTRIQPHHVWTPDIFLEEDVGASVTSGLHSHKTSVIIYSGMNIILISGPRDPNDQFNTQCAQNG